MNKRLLRKIPIMDADIEMINTAKRFDDDSIKYFVLGRTVDAENKKILLLYFFPRCKLAEENIKAEFRTFLTDDDYITQRLDCQSIKWLTGSFENVLSYNYRYTSWWAQIYLFDDETVKAIQILTGTKKTPLIGLEDHQSHIRAARLAIQHKKITDRIDEKMQVVPKLLDDFKKWLDKTAFAKKRYVFYVYKKGKKKQDGYCAACHHAVEIESPRHCKQGICPNCNRQITYMVSGKSKNVFDSMNVAVFQKIPTGFVVRYINVHRQYPHLKSPAFTLFEETRDFYEGDNHSMYWYGRFKQTGNVRWCDNPNGYGNARAVIYEKTITEAIADSAYRYCAIKDFALHEEGATVNVFGYIQRYKRKPFIEYLTKLRLYRLVKDLSEGSFVHELNDKGRSVTEILQVKKQYISLLQERDVTPSELGLIQEFSKLGRAVTAEELQYIEKKFQYIANDIVRLSRYASITKIENYCDKRVNKQNDFNDVFITWKDYVTACEKLGYDLKNDFVLFPKHLNRVHDTVIARAEKKDKAERTKILGEKSKTLVNYFNSLQQEFGYESETFIVLAPRNLNEIVNEGHVLRHCVGGYAENVADKKTIVLFVRFKNNKRKSFFTMEIKNNSIIQCRGKKNCNMPDEVKEFVEEYRTNVLSRMVRKAG